jgi:N-acetylmuramic acid 6-phosphate etherase
LHYYTAKPLIGWKKVDKRYLFGIYIQITAIPALEPLMTLRATETPHPDASGLDQMADNAILDVLFQGQIQAAKAVAQAQPDIQHGATLMAETLGNNGRLFYAAAGSSGLMGMADGLELSGTFGIPPHSIRILLAGGQASLTHLTGAVEDDRQAAQTDAGDITDRDCVIALSASGSTPYPLAVLQHAQAKGARTIAMINTPDSPMAKLAKATIYLPTPPEPIAGSTRLGAATAQKIALNMMSSLMGVMLGHVYDGLMVNVQADNIKLRARAVRIVARIAQITLPMAAGFLDKANGKVKPAVMLAKGAADPEQANNLLEKAGQNLRVALFELKSENIR